MKNLIQNILFFTLLSITNAAALIEIDITEGNRVPLPIAITNFFYDDVDAGMLSKISNNCKPEVLISSSSSGLLPSRIFSKCKNNKRGIIGHPFNPPYLLPLVEIVGGKKTSPNALEWSGKFYEAAGKSPLIMKKEIPGFVATRLQEALWREALHMVANGEATPADIDNALMNGPAPRMAVQGQCMAFHVACGEGGMATNLDQFGPALKLPWTRLKAPELTKELRDRMVEGCNVIAGDQCFEDMAAKRDAKIVAVLRAIRETN